MLLMAFKYVIDHVPGKANAWENLLSRWGAGAPLQVTLRTARLAVIERVSLLEEAELV